MLAVALAPLAHAAQVSVQLEGLSGDAEASVVDALEIDHYKDRQVSRAQVRRLYARAEEQIRTALEPYGFYNVVIDGELKTSGENFIAVLKVTPGPPTVVKALEITLSEGSEGVTTVDRARARFEPHLNQSLDHAAYERSKGDIQGALFGSGFLRAELTQHEVRVTRATNTAEIDLHWNVGERYRFGTTTFEGGQFPDSFLDRYIPWTVDQYYSSTELLALQQALVDADYFSIAQVQPDVEHAADGRVPIKVMLAPAKRTVYTGGVFYGTDTGAGVRGDVQRRWINQRGHKLGVETVFAERLTMVSTRYTIPLPGRDNHTVGFGFAYRDENTATSQSKTFRLAATDTRLWHAWIRTIGLQFLTGDFKVAEQKGNTTLLYPEVSLTRKKTDDPNFTRRGWSVTVAARGAYDGLMSDTSFGQVTADAKWIHGFGENGRFIARGTLGYTRVGDFNKLPPELRFFAGGDRSIRGYAFQTIGPRDLDGDVIGGERLAVASAEYEHYFTEKWGAAVFVDAGDAFSRKDFDLKIGTGAGVRWRSPVGMVRVDIGVPIGDKYAKGVELHVVIGPDL